MPRSKKADCSQCQYSFELRATQEVFCRYILIEGHRRGCPGGSKCTKFKKGPRLREVFNPYGNRSLS